MWEVTVDRKESRMLRRMTSDSPLDAAAALEAELLPDSVHPTNLAKRLSSFRVLLLFKFGHKWIVFQYLAFLLIYFYGYQMERCNLKRIQLVSRPAFVTAFSSGTAH